MIAFIPARGGSKGVIKKNIKLINGQPLITWTLKAAISSTRVSEIYVSTDDCDIADIGREYGVRIVDRPPELAGDQSTTESAIEHFVNFLPSLRTDQKICLLQCTSPIRERDELDNMYNFHQCGQYDSSFTACVVEQFLWRHSDYPAVLPLNYDYNARPRRQDRKKQDRLMVETGASYIFQADNFLKSRSRLHGKIGAFLVPNRNAKEIDTLEDLREAEALLRLEG